MPQVLVINKYAVRSQSIRYIQIDYMNRCQNVKKFIVVLELVTGHAYRRRA
jgi:hypothetical protein